MFPKLFCYAIFVYVLRIVTSQPTIRNLYIKGPLRPQGVPKKCPMCKFGIAQEVLNLHEKQSYFQRAET